MPHHPKTIFIIRHAEKPDDLGDPHLSPRGQQRAAALPRYPFPKLAAIFAARISSESERPVETVTPIKTDRNMSLSADVKDREFQKLVAQVMSEDFKDTEILICWHHGEIPALAAALGAKVPPNYKWPDDVFDRVWVLSYGADGSVNREDRPQRLLPGDSQT
jgi:broad specificity phosphatase PhoE